MYLYFSNTRKLQTMIAHGSPVRQGDSFGLNVCFDLDFFKSEGNTQYQNAPLYCYYKLPKSDSFEVQPLELENKNVRKFRKNSNDEVTFKLVDDKKYFMYYAPINANQLTGNCGDLELVFSFYQLEENEINASDFSAKLYVEPTFGKNQPEPDSSITLTDYQFLLGEITKIAQEKNIALEKIEDIEYTLNASVEEKLLTRANYIYDSMAESKMGWVIIGATYKTVQQEVDGTMQDVEVIDVSDMYVLFSEDNMFVISSETGIIYKYTKYDDQYVLIPQMYSVNVFGDTLDSFIESLGKANLQELLQSFLSRISDLEVTTIQDIVYSDGKIKYKQNNSYHDLVTNAQLKENLGINTIEGQGTFGVEYTEKTLKAKNGLNSQKTTLFTAGSLKQDMNLDLVDNKPSYSQVVDNANYVATTKAVFDTLQNILATLENASEGNQNQNTSTPKFNDMMRKIRFMYEFFNDGTQDIDNKINKLEEIISILNNLPENYNIYDVVNNLFGLITDIHNRLGETDNGNYFYDATLPVADRAQFTVKGRIEYLYQNADKNIIVFIRYSEPGNQELLTIPVANWVALNQPNENYPDAEYYAIINPRTVENPNNPAFDNVVDMEVIFDKESEKEYIVGAEFDTEQRVLNIYANSLPDAAITIDTIKLISNVHHTMSLNKNSLDQIAKNKDDITQNTSDISILARDKQEKSNLVTSFSAEPSDTKYPSEKLVKDNLDALDNAKQDKANLITSFQTTSDDTHYPSEKLVKDNLDLKQDKTNLVASFQTTPDDTHYPSEKLVKDSLDTLTTNITNLGNDKQDKSYRISAFQTTPDDTHYPSEKLVKDNLDLKQTIANKINDFNNNVDNNHYPSALAVKNQLDLKQTIANKITSLSSNVDDNHYPSAQLVENNYLRKNFGSSSSLNIELNKTYKIDGQFKIFVESYHSGSGQSDPSNANRKYVILRNCIFKITATGARSCSYQYIDGTTTHQTSTTSIDIGWTYQTASVDTVSSETSSEVSFSYIGILNKLD